MISKKIRLEFSHVLVSMSFALLAVACSSNKNEPVGEHNVTLRVSVSGDEIDSVENTYNRAAIKHGDQHQVTDQKVLEEFEFDQDFYISSELTTDKASFVPPATNRNNSAKAEIVRNPIQRQIVFRMVIYDAGGNYVIDKNYNIAASGAVSASNGQDLTLPSGRYSFIAYSYNTNTAPNEPLQTSTINSSLAINPAITPQFMMYNSGLITVSPTETTNLNIVFKYKFSPVRVIVDASRTNGYLITNIGNTTLSSTRSGAQINLASQQVTFSGNTATTTITFPTSELNKDVATSDLFWMATNQANGALTVNSLTIGPLSRTTALTLNNVEVRPGFGYFLRLRILPTDRFETIGGQDAALIGGRYWMRRNLGAPTNVNPDNPPSGNFQSLFGNYYQWGRTGIRATPTTGSTAADNTLWTTRAGNGAWNSGSLNSPTKTGNDPCPTGWRVPTRVEFQELINSTTQLQADNNGTNWAASNTKYTSAKVFRSRRDRNVMLTLPAAGNYVPENRSLASRGNAGAYWTSTEDPNSASNAFRMLITQADGAASIGVGTNNRNFAVSIRCVQQ